MPGQLFNDAERRRLGGYPPQVPQEDLVTFYTLTRADKAQVNRCIDAASRLGFAPPARDAPPPGILPR